MVLGDRIFELLHALDISQSELANRVGVKQPTINRLIKGQQDGSKHIHNIAKELGTTVEYLTGETNDPSHRTSTSNADELNLASDLIIKQNEIVKSLAAIKRIDLNFGMGATYLDNPVEENIEYFPVQFLRSYTNAKPSDLMWAKGSGDSMNPTISDQDLLLIDSSQNHITMADKIWAVAYGEIGMIKRLRPMPDGSVKILSDNLQVPDDIAVDGELHVLGRVVAIVRKI